MGALRQAIQDVKKDFGSLASNEGKAVMQMWKGLNSSSGALAKSGISVRMVFGNIAERLKYVHDMAKAAGNQFHFLKDMFVENVDKIALFTKGTSVSMEGITALGNRAKSSGRDISEYIGEAAQSMVGLSKKYGISVKEIGKNFDEMIKDVDHFGHLAPDVLAATAVYAKKLLGK